MNGKGTWNRRMQAGLSALLVVLITGCEWQGGENIQPTTATTEWVTELEPSEASTAPPTLEPGSIAPFPSEEQEYNWEKTAMIATDIHYLARTLTDGGDGFRYMVDHGDGKVLQYIEPIVDAFIAEVIEKKPDMLILSGDLTLDGEKESHEELARKLDAIKRAGIPIVVIPGNHDVNNHHAAEYRGNTRLPASYTTAEEFARIYGAFGYEEAVSRDSGSLSYVYQVDEYNRLLMLDTCQYDQRAKVGGAILSDTYDWIDLQLEEAWEDGMNIIPVAHHNLLDQSEIYVEDCTIEHSEQLVERLENWDVPLFLSGHLHVQHNKQSEDDSGIWEIVTGSLSTPSCRYGMLTFRDDGSFAYETRELDVERWAKAVGRKEKDLLEFSTFQEPFLRRVFYNQSYDALSKIAGLTESQRERMSKLYSQLNYHYYQGTVVEIREDVLKNPDYQLWLEDGSFTVLSDYVQYIVGDGVRDYNLVEE